VARSAWHNSAGAALRRVAPWFELGLGLTYHKIDADAGADIDVLALIGPDYDQGSDRDRFVYDVRTFGPVLKLGYSF